ncbi:stage II sporulation protein M [Paenibacillus larvae]|nr:stage II sporulation protein M [Paenibacillus larvae]MBH0343095.1 hypothetical protein [Paenibacillus larvae]MCY7519964.1 stage II sporulation protein M [Paenibacillus larvae]MCY9502880.1 stage II sporulation protein M [Paenibacillus larvae]MCY9677547.1 stage II sporulation protein M [Paenibacillus larvae]MCY9744284.1 stage II sporulation protein M [Paenibacillus larvae]
MKMGVFKYYWQTYSTKSILIILVFIASFLWGMISQSYQNPLVISSPNLTWMDYFFHNTKQAFLTILLGFVTYGFGSLALGAISGISAGVGIEITLQTLWVKVLLQHFSRMLFLKYLQYCCLASIRL